MKICSLLPSGTEIVYALGLQDALIGVSDLCDYPPEAAGKPVFSRSKIDPSALSSEEVEQAMRALLAAGENPYELDYDRLAAAAPDLILTQDLCHICEIDAGEVSAVVRGMQRHPQVLELNPRTLEDIFDTFRQVGAAGGVDDRAAALVDDCRRRAAAVAASMPPELPRPCVVSLEGVNPLVGGGHWIPDLLARAGGLPAPLQPGDGARRLDWAEITQAAPQKLFVDLCSSDIARNLREVPWLAARPGWRELPAVAAGEVYLIDHSYFSRPGPRVVEGLEILAQLTHPGRFAGLIPPGAVAKLDAAAAAQTPAADIAQCFQPYP